MTWWQGVIVFVLGTIAMMLFAAATQGFMFVKNRIWETAAMLLIAFTLFRPDFWLNMVQPPFIEHDGAQVARLAEKAPEGALFRVRVEGPDFNDPDRIKGTTLNVELKAGKDGLDRLQKSGLTVVMKDGQATLEEPMAGTPFFSLARQFDFYADKPVKIARVFTPAERMAKEWFFIPALLLLGLIVLLQLRRRGRQHPAPATA